MKKYDTPYGKKTAGLLMLAMDAYTREEKAAKLIEDIAKYLAKYAPTDATHEGLEICDLIKDANSWLAKRKQQIANTTNKL